MLRKAAIQFGRSPPRMFTTGQSLPQRQRSGPKVSITCST